MKFSIATQALVGATAVSALSLPAIVKKLADPLPLSQFKPFKTMTADDIKQGKKPPAMDMSSVTKPNFDLDNWSAEIWGNTTGGDDTMTIAADCTNPNMRFEWRDYSDSDKKAFVDGIRCLMDRPASGNFPPARNRYEDIVRVHQMYTNNIHQNQKFLLWHRYYLWTLEQIMRSECGFNRAFPWWDETKDAGRFAQSSIFTAPYFGSLPRATNGQGTCVTNGRFAGVTLNIGPGSGNTPHCLSRAVDEGQTAQCNADFVRTCNSRTSYIDFANCLEYGPHAYGHNGIGSVMSEVSASPGDPVFFLHHSFVDRVYRVWQNADVARRTTIQGNEANGPLTLDTWISVGGLRPNVRVRDVLNTLDGVMCYRYTY